CRRTKPTSSPVVAPEVSRGSAAGAPGSAEQPGPWCTGRPVFPLPAGSGLLTESRSAGGRRNLSPGPPGRGTSGAAGPRTAGDPGLGTRPGSHGGGPPSPAAAAVSVGDVRPLPA